ncbi:hypothetical protein ACOMHN_005847 [Nucella lapillus]
MVMTKMKPGKFSSSSSSDYRATTPYDLDLSDPRLSPRVMFTGCDPDLDAEHVQNVKGRTVQGRGAGSGTSVIVHSFLKARVSPRSFCSSHHKGFSSRCPSGAVLGRMDYHKQQQLGAYVAWVNSQLKKKPGVHLIEDLRNDMRDGVVFADIIEIVAKEPISGIYEVPATYEEMRHNVELVLKFMISHRIKMHRIHATDVVEGNLKAVMRLILAMAAHYKPMSVRHSTHSSSDRSSSRRQSVMDIAQGASAALTEARRNAKKAGKRLARYIPDSKFQESSSEACSDSDQPPHQRSSRHLLVPGPGEQRELDGCSADNSPVSSPRSSFSLPDGSTGPEVDGCSADNSPVSSPRSSFSLPDGSTGPEGGEGEEGGDSGSLTAWDHSSVETIKTMKKQLLQLQDLMLENSADSGVEGEEGDPPPGPASADDWALVRSRLQHTTLVSQDLREEASLLRNDCLQLQGTKAGLQQRLGEQDAMLSQLKSDKLHLEIELQTLAAENASLRKQLTGHVGQIQGEVARRERTISRLHQEITQPQGVSLAGPDQVTMRRSCPPLRSDPPQSGPHPVGKDLGVVRGCLQEMQTLLMSCGPQDTPPLDRLESQVLSLLSAVRAGRHGDQESGKGNNVNNGTGISELRPVAHQPRKSPGAERLLGEGGDGPKTWVVYFTDFSEQPRSCTIPGRLGEIRLGDFKKLFEDCEHYRYYFKALDPEYGTVKEELTKEEAIIPGWEDKIVAWVETDVGTPC